MCKLLGVVAWWLTQLSSTKMAAVAMAVRLPYR
jgi:hypothetical protein